MKKIIIVNGYPQAGKTTLEKIIQEHVKTTIYSSIDPVKEYARHYFGYKDEKTEQWRRFLSELKKLLTDEFDLIYKKVSKHIEEFYNSDAEIIMIDSREPIEIERFKNEFNAVTLFVRNSRAERVTSNESDANVENYVYDYYIDNNGTLEELEQKALEFIDKLN